MVRKELVSKVNKIFFDENTIKLIGFLEPLFKYPDACLGCDETPYLKS